VTVEIAVKIFELKMFTILLFLLPSLLLCEPPDQQVDFLPPRGVFTAPFKLTLSSPFVGATFIKYTLNAAVNAVPSFASASVGINYTAPILIDRSCLVTAMAFLPPGLASNISFHVCFVNLAVILYLFVCCILYSYFA
jgi:hypothetical protein